MSKKKIIIGGIVAIIIIGALYVWREFNRTVEHLGDIPADYSVNATALINEYTGNESAADQKYQNKILSVQGMVKKVEDTDTTSIIILGDTTDMSSVRCIMENNHQQKAGSLQRGKVVTIKGAITGFKKDETGLLGSDVELNRCVFAN
jgi:hypothetical protein